MIEDIKKVIRRWKWERLPFKSLGKTIKIGKGYNVIGADCISIGYGFSSEEHLKLQAWKRYRGQTFTPRLTIGNHVSMMDQCQISCCDSVSIGDGTLFGANVFVTDNYHGSSAGNELDTPPLERKLFSKGGIEIGKNVWIGRNVCIMPGVSIGDGAVIGANSVVTKSIPAHAVAAGVPARVIRQEALFSDADVR